MWYSISEVVSSANLEDFLTFLDDFPLVLEGLSSLLAKLWKQNSRLIQLSYMNWLSLGLSLITVWFRSSRSQFQTTFSLFQYSGILQIQVIMLSQLFDPGFSTKNSCMSNLWTSASCISESAMVKKVDTQMIELSFPLDDIVLRQVIRSFDAQKFRGEWDQSSPLVSFLKSRQSSKHEEVSKQYLPWSILRHPHNPSYQDRFVLNGTWN